MARETSSERILNVTFSWRYRLRPKENLIRPLDLTAFIGISDHVHIIHAALENAAFQNRVLARDPTKRVPNLDLP